MPDRCDLGLSATAATHVTAVGTMAASVARVSVAESRLRRAVSGRLRRPPPGPLRGGSGRVRRRAVVLRGFIYVSSSPRGGIIVTYRKHWRRIEHDEEGKGVN